MRSLLSALITAFGVLGATVALLTTGSRATALGVLLDMLLAAGLLRLAGEQSWTEIAVLVAIVALRLLVRTALTADFRRRSRDGKRPAERVDRAFPR
ncbi:DUF1622 domain-containing protein [Verrucosispora sp. WMMA2044]|uniref:DUF1622 domain-containing protein n=1 Tax=Verrucosispora sioxanthis TaxID=2499994 RepID=A0A6M1L5Z5_9ACTN|nr:MULTISPECIES: DUF1622 domain-containing protein [Micromonospora]NEE64314.1 DUF1622 domain-containing protein [Verrucosispora sioxanthis]NGM13424.1 DUF1622 domain-containing protein [Verrucosispora sioxanthis]WBB51401.1 DUF1622 domain-containing protein [Verrucosispora sp. WMMA2044]